MAVNDKNKVKFGLKKVHYAKATIDESTGTASYGTPVPWPGAVNLALEAQGETTKFRADDINYFVSQGNDGYQGDLESAKIPESFLVDIMGYIKHTDGLVYEDVEAQPSPFALLFEFNGDKNHTRHVLYNCTATRPATASKTTEASITPVTDTVQITTAAIYNSVLAKNIAKASCAEDDTPYASFFSAVYQPAT